MASRTPHQCTQAGQEFFRDKRLGQIVVGAGVEARHLLAPAITRREDENRHVLAARPPFLEHAHAVHLRQAEVQHSCVIRLGLAEEVSFLAVRRQVNGIARLRQRFTQLPAQIGIVFDNKNSHRWIQPLLFSPCRRINAQVEATTIFRHPRNDVVPAGLPRIEMLTAIL